MSESKASCLKCGGHIVYPKELAGQEIACPHCNETIRLPESKNALPWIIACASGFVAVCIASLLMWQHHPGVSKSTRDSLIQNASQASKGEPMKIAAKEETAVNSDVQAMKDLCRDYYAAINNQDVEAFSGTLSEACRLVLKPDALKKILINEQNNKFDFEDLESIKIQNGNLGQCATGRAKRIVLQPGARAVEGWRQINFFHSHPTGNAWKPQKIRTF